MLFAYFWACSPETDCRSPDLPNWAGINQCGYQAFPGWRSISYSGIYNEHPITKYPLYTSLIKTREQSYSGCWTCRNRHVKCDENRPVCKRCAAASVDCQGYKIRLTWKGHGQNSNASDPPRNVQPTYTHCSSLRAGNRSVPSSLTKAEIASIQQNLDDVKGGSSSSMGLFSVFYTQSLPTSTDSTQGLHPVTTNFTKETEKNNTDLDITLRYLSSDDDSWSTNSSIHRQSSMTGDPSSVLQCEDNNTESEGACQNRNPSPISYNIWEDNIFQSTDHLIHSIEPLSSSPDLSHLVTSVTGATFAEEAPHAELSNGQSSLNFNTQEVCSVQYQSHRARPGILHLDFLPAPIDQKELVHHWVTFLSCAMAPVPIFGNPGGNTLTSIALAGLASTFQESNGEIAVFHGICAASAFSLYQLRQSSDRFHKLAIKHSQLATFVIAC